MGTSELLFWREKQLLALPKWIWPYTCRCRKFYGQWFDSIRGVWCCDRCNLPGAERDINQWKKLVEQCVDCGNDFVRWSLYVSDMTCANCGGDNEAPKGKRNLNPGTMKEDYESSE